MSRIPTPAVEALASLESREVENLARQLVRSQYRSEQLLRRSRYSRNDCGSGIRPVAGRTGSRAAGRIMVVPDRKPDTTDQLRQRIPRRPSHIDGARRVDCGPDWRMEKKQHMRWTRHGAQMLLNARCALLNGELGKYTRWSPSESSQVLAAAA
jgi:hypothetical protein